MRNLMLLIILKINLIFIKYNISIKNVIVRNFYNKKLFWNI